jgi:beta-glucosidase
VHAALAASQASESVVDEHVRRILRTLFAFGFFDRDAYVDDDAQIDKQAHHDVAGRLEERGMVLLENDGAILPLDAAAIGKLALIGPEATVLKNGGGSSNVAAFLQTTPRQGIEARLGAGKVVYDEGDDLARAAQVAQSADVAVVVVGDNMSEGADKPCMGLDCSKAATDPVVRDALISAVAAAQPKTVVVLQSGGPITTPWRDRVPGLLEAWFPGQNGGTAIARVLFGDGEPGGRLPATFPLREADEPTAGDPEAYPGVAERVRYKEGVLIGYRWFDERKLGVAYPFGHGLSYTTFRYRGLRLEPSAGGDAKVSVRVENTGKRAGTAVPQLYIGQPAPRGGGVMPPWQLKGFDRVRLKPGAARRVSFELDERAFSHWSTTADRWDVTPGCHLVGVGGSSRDLPLRGTIGRGISTCEGALQLPRDARSCTSRRSFVIRLPKSLRSARVTVGGERARVTRRGRRLTARIDLRGRRAGHVVVRITGRTARGKVVRQTRVYRPCA